MVLVQGWTWGIFLSGNVTLSCLKSGSRHPALLMRSGADREAAGRYTNSIDGVDYSPHPKHRSDGVDCWSNTRSRRLVVAVVFTGCRMIMKVIFLCC